MYTMLNNQESSKFDLYLPGKLVASLHYTLSTEEIMFIYCEAVEKADSEAHCKELMKRSLEDARNRRVKILISCPIALKHLEDNCARGFNVVTTDNT